VALGQVDPEKLHVVRVDEAVRLLLVDRRACLLATLLVVEQGAWYALRGALVVDNDVALEERRGHVHVGLGYEALLLRSGDMWGLFRAGAGARTLHGGVVDWRKGLA
jgi:hypothetical protein